MGFLLKKSVRILYGVKKETVVSKFLCGLRFGVDVYIGCIYSQKCVSEKTDGVSHICIVIDKSSLFN